MIFFTVLCINDCGVTLDAVCSNGWCRPIRGLNGGQFRDSVISTHLSNFIYLTYDDSMLEYEYDYIHTNEYRVQTPDSIMLFCNRT